MNLIPRNKDIKILKNLLEKFSIVVLHGSRRIGKTTLAKQLNPDYYFSLDVLDIKESIVDKVNDLEGFVVIDEIQNNLDLISKIKTIVESRENIKFLILGSASSIIVTESRKKITGRAVFYELKGLKLSDIKFDVDSHFLKGGLPMSYTLDESTSFKYRTDYLAGVIFREISESGLRLSPHLVHGFLRNIALSSGRFFNKTEAASLLSVSRNTIETYLSFFENTSLIRVVHNTINQRKSPKIYFRDSGLLNCLGNIQTSEELISSKNLNQLWESYVMESILNEYNLEGAKYFIDRENYSEVNFIVNYNNKQYGINTHYFAKDININRYNDIVKKLDLELLLFVNNSNQNEFINSKSISVSLNNINEVFNIKGFSDSKMKKPVSDKGHVLPKAFISYSHKDSNFVNDLKNKLEQSEIDIVIDINKLKFGDNINDFISETIRTTEYTVQIISVNSLRSPYVMIEYLEAQLYEDAEQSKKYIPICIDKSVFEDNTYIELADDIQNEIDEVNKYIQEAISRNLNAALYNSKRDRLIDLKNNLGKAMDRLRNSLIGDFTDNKTSSENIKRLIKALVN